MLVTALNRHIGYDKAAEIALKAWREEKTLKEAALALDGAELTCLRNDFANASKAMNFGQPLAQAAPLSRLRRDIAQLALNIKKRQPQKQSSGAYTP